jgi:membrane protease YdiL (CAAX protease family)
LWGAVMVVLFMCLIGGISLNEIGFRKISFNHGFWFTLVVLILNGLLIIYSLYNLIASLTSAKFREEAIKTADFGTISVLPRSKKEKRLFTFVAFSAGVCEEIIFRGFLVFLFLAIFTGIPIYLVIVITGVIFGIGHLYQGLQGVVTTAVVGTLYMCLFLVTDSLILPIILHFFLDFSSTFILSAETKSTNELEINTDADVCVDRLQ